MSDGASPRAHPEWSELATLIDALLEVEPERREARIRELAGGDPDRRAQLEALLEECEQESELLDSHASERFSALLEDDLVDFPDALAERYEVKEKLGQGGMATVYLARDVKHGRDVAVKLLHSVVADALGADRFLREIEIAAQLHHPLIVPLYDSGEAAGRLYYVMPYVSEFSLRERLARDGSVPIKDALSILRDVCDALAHAHGRGIVHRDIKPGNVLLAGRHALVADFGVAKAVSDARPQPALTAAGIVVGTPAYMAPEQVVADPAVDHRADIYAVGALAYELLTGSPPFVGESRQAVLAAQLADTPVPLAARRPDVPGWLAELVMRCLEKRPDDRWQSAEELVQRFDASGVEREAIPQSPRGRHSWLRMGVGVAVILMAAVLTALALRGDSSDDVWQTRWSNARIERLTDFPGDEVDAAISADGKFIAFLADRDSGFDAFVTQIGSGEFVNLTTGRYPQLFNDDVRNVGFSGDGAHVWLRAGEIASPAGVKLVPTLGGSFRPFIGTAVMTVWSPDGSKVAYHEATLGDAIHVANSDGSNARRIFVGAPGLHSHHLSWSTDGRHLYYSHGSPPEEMDIWRIPVEGGEPERLTRHVSRVAYPVMVDDRTLLYTATAEDGTGPWLYAMDVRSRTPQRLSAGVEHYVSIAAASVTSPGNRRRVVATVSNPNVQLWSVPITDGVVEEEDAQRIALPTARAAAPRFEADSSILYLASRGGADGLWRLVAGTAREVWRPNEGALAGAAATSPKSGRICIPLRRNTRSTLHCGDRDASGVAPFAPSLDVRGSPSWSPDGEWLAVAAADTVGLRVYKVPAAGGTPIRLVDSIASNPLWSPDGALIVFSGTPRGRSVPVRAVTPDGKPVRLPSLTVDRVGDSYRFLPGTTQLVIKLGGFRRQDFWLFDLGNGQSRRLTRLRPGESIRRFDVSPDGTRILFERVRQNSDVVLIELPDR
jgi:serine/threonine protein kinase